MTNSEDMAVSGVSGTEMKEAFKNIPALKQIALLDACNSGAFAESYAYRGAAEEQALARLSRSTGAVIIAATRADQFASEIATLGHGAFTTAVLEALHGEAYSSNGQITAGGLRGYLDNRLPDITEEFSGTAQYPITFMFGQDFPIGLKK